jgi:two-component system cell cycle sensor histidine kinase/response regulator CckA
MIRAWHPRETLPPLALGVAYGAVWAAWWLLTASGTAGRHVSAAALVVASGVALVALARRREDPMVAYAPLLAHRHLGAVLSRRSDGVILHVSPALLEHMGVQREEVVGRSGVAMGFWADDASRLAWIDAVTREGPSPLREFSIPRPHGGGWNVLVTVVAIDLPEGPGVLSLVLDATERARALDALNLSEERLRLAMEASEEGFWDWRLDTGTLYVSPRCFSLLGEPQPPGATSPEWWRARLHPDDAPRLADAVEAIGRGHDESVLLECRLRTQDGAYPWLLAKTRVAARSADGRPVRVLGTLVDVTRRRQAEIERAASERRFRTLVEASPDLVFLLDREERVLYLNSAAARALGRSVEQAVGSRQAELFPASTSEQHSKALQDLFRTGQPFRSEAPHEMGGRTIWIETQLTPLRDETGDVVSVLGIARDITARRDAERELRRAFQRTTDILEGTSDGVLTLDGDLVIRTFNRAAERLLGRGRGEVLGRGWLEAFPEMRGSFFDTRLQQASRTATPAAFEVHLTVSPYANWYDVRVFPIQEGLSVFFRVTTDRKRLEEQLAQAQKMEAMGRLAGGVAHDFNNQLAAILGYDELLLRDLPPQHPARPRAEQIRRAAERAATLTRQLLAFGRKQVLEPRLLNLNVVVADLEELLRRTIGEDVEMTVTLAPGLHSVKADRAQVEQALLNLVVNARDAMPRGGSLIIETRDVTLSEAECVRRVGAEPGEYVELSVEDSGTGMDPSVRTRLFEPFFTTKEFGKGTGLGLSIVYGFVSQSGGHITVESEPGRGSRFCILLPRRELVAETSTSPGPPAAFSSRHGTEGILVMEAEPSLRRLIVEVLRASGYSVIEAATHDDAVSAAARDHDTIDLLVVDLQAGGPALLARLAEERPGLRGLFMLGHADPEPNDSPSSDSVTVLRKPFAPTTLARRVREALDRSTT